MQPTFGQHRGRKSAFTEVVECPDGVFATVRILHFSYDERMLATLRNYLYSVTACDHDTVSQPKHNEALKNLRQNPDYNKGSTN